MLLAMTRIVHDTLDQPVMLLKALYRPDQYDYAMEQRTDDDGLPIWVHRDAEADRPTPI